MSLALIIEDELVIAFSIEEALRQIGYTTFEIATSVDQAVEAAERQCPDLIITNHRIAGGTGTDAVLAICSDKAIPVVFVSASGPEIRDRLPDALIVDKPFTLPRLESAVETAARRPFRHLPNQDGPTLRVVE